MIKIPLLPWQSEFASDIDTPELGMLGGLNSGKTWVYCIKAVILAAVNAKGQQNVTRGGLFQPTNHLVVTHLVPNFMGILQQMGVRYTYHASQQIIDLEFANGNFPILMQSAENHSRIVGYNWAFAGFEELDTSPFELAQLAYKKGKERVRWGKHRQVFTTSTIEGNKFLQYNFVEQANDRKRTIHANTEDNPLADPEWLAQQKEDMSPQEYAVRIQGNWGSILSKRVYADYLDELHPLGNLTTLEKKDFPVGTPIHCGMDFNTGKCYTGIHMLDPEGWPVQIDELSTVKNRHTIENLKQRFRDNPVICYPDTSGDNQNYIGYDTAIGELRAAGFVVRLNSRKQATSSEDLKKGSNPFIGDRIHTVNGLILNTAGKRRMRVNHRKCPLAHRTWMSQEWVRKGKNDTDVADKSRDIDHPADGNGYFYEYLFGRKNRPTMRTM